MEGLGGCKSTPAPRPLPAVDLWGGGNSSWWQQLVTAAGDIDCLWYLFLNYGVNVEGKPPTTCPLSSPSGPVTSRLLPLPHHSPPPPPLHTPRRVWWQRSTRPPSGCPPGRVGGRLSAVQGHGRAGLASAQSRQGNTCVITYVNSIPYIHFSMFVIVFCKYN